MCSEPIELLSRMMNRVERPEPPISVDKPMVPIGEEIANQHHFDRLQKPGLIRTERMKRHCPRADPKLARQKDEKAQDRPFKKHVLAEEKDRICRPAFSNQFLLGLRREEKL